MSIDLAGKHGPPIAAPSTAVTAWRPGPQHSSHNYWLYNTIAEVRLVNAPNSDVIRVNGNGEWKWNATDTTADDGTESTSAIQITGITTGRYLRNAGSSILSRLPNGTTQAVSSIRVTDDDTVASGQLDLRMAFQRAIPGLTELLEYDWLSLYLPPSAAGITHQIDAGSIARWIDVAHTDGALDWVQTTHARQPLRGISGTLPALEFVRASEHRMTRATPTYTGRTSLTRVFGILHDDNVGSLIIAPEVTSNASLQLEMGCNLNGTTTYTVYMNSGGDACVYTIGAAGTMRQVIVSYDGSQGTSADRLEAFVAGSATEASESAIGTIPTSLVAKTSEYLGTRPALDAYFSGKIAFFGELPGAYAASTQALADLQRAIKNVIGV